MRSQTITQQMNSVPGQLQLVLKGNKYVRRTYYSPLKQFAENPADLQEGSKLSVGYSFSKCSQNFGNPPKKGIILCNLGFAKSLQASCKQILHASSPFSLVQTKAALH